MKNPFQIYFDRLKDGHKEKISFDAPPDFLDLHERDLSFPNPVSVKGEAYLAEDHLVLHLKIKTSAVIPCLMCNDPVPVGIEIGDFYHAEPTENLKSGIFDYMEILREAVLLQVPHYIECNEGKCPTRETAKKYLKKPEVKKTEASTFPFSDLGE